jgi:hypothetical protein
MPNRSASWLRDGTALPGVHCPALISASITRATWRYRGIPDRSSRSSDTLVTLVDQVEQVTYGMHQVD